MDLEKKAESLVQGGISTDIMACMQKLMPCQLFTHSSSPPATCCTPLKEVVTQESQCLCKVTRDPQLLKTVNLTLDQSLALSKACGIDADVSVCKNGSSSDSSNTSSSSKSDADVRIIDARVSFLFIVSIAALMLT
ncbi:hypothetical protein PTKIN_Ptkin05aG0125100 [Pterospermum kingtungense]